MDKFYFEVPDIGRKEAAIDYINDCEQQNLWFTWIKGGDILVSIAGTGNYITVSAQERPASECCGAGRTNRNEDERRSGSCSCGKRILNRKFWKMEW